MRQTKIESERKTVFHNTAPEPKDTELAAIRPLRPFTEPSKEMVLITGNTFPVKDKLKAIGGKWDPVAKGWRVPREMRMAAQVLVGNADQFEQLPGMEEI